jgi:predicted RNase H-like HicB family nuclease
MDAQTFTVQAVWDAEANVWVAESDDIPGLVTEGTSQEELLEKLTSLVPELLELNNCRTDRTKPIEIVVQYRSEERIRVPITA